MNEPSSPLPELLDQMSIARQPIVSPERSVLAYQLFNRSTRANQHSEASDLALALHAVAESGAPFSTQKHDIFIHSVHKGLTGPQWDLLPPATTVVEISHAPSHSADFVQALVPALQALKARGFRLAFKHSVVAPVYKPWQGLADFVKLDVGRIEPAQYKPLVHATKARTNAVLIAEKIEQQTQFESMLALGVGEFQGYWLSVPETTRSKVLSPAQASALHLFQLLRSGAELEQVETALKKDAGLGVSLLRIINAASSGLPQKVTSLRQAVMLIGYERLVRWSALVLTNTSAHASIPGTAAVVRGRMMELLALEQAGVEAADSAFLVGLLSQLDRLLGRPMPELLEQLALEDGVAETLLTGRGAYGDLLALVCACESDSETDFSHAFAKLPFTLKQVNIAHMEALVWADSLAT